MDSPISTLFSGWLTGVWLEYSPRVNSSWYMMNSIALFTQIQECGPNLAFCWKSYLPQTCLSVISSLESGRITISWLLYWRVTRTLFYCFQCVWATIEAFFQSVTTEHPFCARPWAKCWKYQMIHSYFHSSCPQNSSTSARRWCNSQTPQFPLPDIHDLTESLALECGQDLWLASNQYDMAKMIGHHSLWLSYII